MRTSTISGVPCWASTYLMYGDDSGLTDEDKAECDKFVASLRKAGRILIEPKEDSREEFNSWPAFGLACDTEDWIAEVVPKEKRKNGGKKKAV